jgi:hypothetical protein
MFSHSNGFSHGVTLHALQPGLPRFVRRSVPKYPKKTARAGLDTLGRLRLFLQLICRNWS